MIKRNENNTWLSFDLKNSRWEAPLNTLGFKGKSRLILESKFPTKDLNKKISISGYAVEQHQFTHLCVYLKHLQRAPTCCARYFGYKYGYPIIPVFKEAQYLKPSRLTSLYNPNSDL